jgi:hypothetical protein
MYTYRRLDSLLNDESMDDTDYDVNIPPYDPLRRPHTVGEGAGDRMQNKIDLHMNKVRDKNLIDIKSWQEFSVKTSTDMKNGPRVTFPVLGSNIGE